MLNFKILKKSEKSRARLGILKTPNGVVETPSLAPVATQAVVKTLTSEEAIAAKCQILIANTFHLHLKPGEKIVKKAGGLHEFMNWQRPLMTDSGGFQVFSLGFGRDFGTGKILKNKQGRRDGYIHSAAPRPSGHGVLRSRTSEGAAPVSELAGRVNGSENISISPIKLGQQPKFLKITEDGVFFKSPIDGGELFLSPKESIKIQESLGADIIFAFDECTSPIADYEYTKKSMEKTHRWAKESLKFKSLKGLKFKPQALFGIVQGGKFKDLRIESAKFISSLGFDGFGIGGEFGDDKKTMADMLRQTISHLPDEKPRHLLGIGHLEDIPKIIKEGVDTFDCTVPTHYARRGIAFIHAPERSSVRDFASSKRFDIAKSKFLNDKNPIDKKCGCFVCGAYKRNYICHLFRAKEITAMKLLTFHNLYFFNSFMEKIRGDIKRGII